MKYNVVEDVAKLSSVKTSILNKMITVASGCICDYVSNIDILDDELVEIDIGLGTLSIQIIDDEIKYRFSPNNRFERNILDTVNSGKSPLVDMAEQSLEKKFFTTYKDLC